jgi:SAM-dependent methyltransferase
LTDSTAATEGPQWSSTAIIWDEHWTRFADPARELIAERTALGPGSRVLDMGCGAGEFLLLAALRGATVSGIDAAEGMLSLARERLEGADLRLGAIEDLPWPEGTFDVVTGFNSFQFAATRQAPFREAARVTRPGGRVAVCVWGDRRRCQLRAVFAAIEELVPVDEPAGEGPPRLGEPGVLEAEAEEAGLRPVDTGEVEIPYEAADLDTLVAACELDVVHLDPPEPLDPVSVRRAIETASGPALRPDGSYRFENVFRWLVAEA